ncbi:MAG TPA: AMP-binding protein, partial [Mycobacterium sp.]|nr:AMP-binding protein [Mycobacterium sp.]
MTQPESPDGVRIPLSRSQQNIYNGVLQDSDPTLYLIGRSYRFHRLEVAEFLTALTATIASNPIQLCVLDPSQTSDGYPDLVRRLQAADIVRVLAYEDRVAHEGREAHTGAVELPRTWLPDIAAKPLVRYTVYTDEAGLVCGLDVHSHHILLDGGGTGIVENDLGRFLEGKPGVEIPGIAEALNGVAKAHLREASKVDESFERLGKVVQHELAVEAHRGGYGQTADDVPGAAAKGVLQESVTISGTSYDAIHSLSERRQVPLNILVAAAAVVVDASLRQSTESLLVHPVDNRFGDPELNVATCLVNSVAQSFRFPAFASVRDVVRALDRGYVTAVRRRWLREEQYRRMYLATNRTSHVEALTLNFLPEPCGPALRPFLSGVPVTTDIGPVESMTVTSVLDEEQRTLNLLIWNRADLSERAPQPRIAERIAATLGSMTAYWDNPIAMVVDEWFGITDDGALRPDDQPAELQEPRVPAWFVNSAGGVSPCRDGRRYIDPWIAWLVQNGAEPGDVLVFTDDNTDRTTDLLIACHLAGCAYSVCDNADQVAQRASIIAGHSDGISTHVIDTGATALAEDLDLDVQGLIDSRLEQVSGDSGLADKTAYIMPTSGSTGLPKLVCVTHESLAVFCHAVKRAYGWGSHDIILQCAPLTSDISVEEVFGGALSGARLIRSPAMKSGDLQALARDLVTYAPTVIDLPTAVWHLLCDDAEAIDAIRGSQLRQIVIGGEAIRSSAVDTWIEAVTAQHIALISSYGPTETTVIVTYLPIARDGSILEGGARLRLGRPLVPGSV